MPMAENELEKLLEELGEEAQSSASQQISEPDTEITKTETTNLKKSERSINEDKVRGLIKRLRESLEAKNRELLQKEIELAITKYPEVAEFRDELKNYLSKGLSPEEAVGALLIKKGKLPTSDISDKTHGKTPPLVEIEKPKEKKIEEMSIEEKLSKLKELEEKGEISLL